MYNTWCIIKRSRFPVLNDLARSEGRQGMVHVDGHFLAAGILPGRLHFWL